MPNVRPAIVPNAWFGCILHGVCERHTPTNPGSCVGKRWHVAIFCWHVCEVHEPRTITRSRHVVDGMHRVWCRVGGTRG